MAVCGSCDARDGERIRSRERSRTGVARVCGDVGSVAAWPSGREWNGSQPGQGASELGFPRPAPGEMQSEAARRAGDRPTRAKTRRLRVLVVTVRSPRPIRAVQRARLCAITWTASQAPLAAKRPDGMWFSPTPYEVAYGVLDLGVAADRPRGLPIAVGDEAVIAVSGEEGELGTGRRLHPPDNEPHRRGVAWSGTGCKSSRQHRRRRPSSREWESSPPPVSPRSGPAGWRAGGR